MRVEEAWLLKPKQLCVQEQILICPGADCWAHECPMLELSPLEALLICCEDPALDLGAAGTHNFKFTLSVFREPNCKACMESINWN